MRSNHTKKNDPWHHSALREVWVDMMRHARFLYDDRRGLPVDETFRTFEGFMLWATTCQGYRMGHNDPYRLERKDIHGKFSPDNCYFTLDPPKRYFEDDGPPITVGASRVTYRNGKDKKAFGLSNTRLYDIWRGMIRRCTDPGQKDYPNYGGRGITVCDEWRHGFQTFYDWAWDHGYSPDLSIDRIDPDGNYEPSNCRWAGNTEQAVNNRHLRGTYRNLRMHVRDMIPVLESMKGNVVVTLVVRSCYLPAVDAELEADYPPVPVEERIDVERKK